MPDRPVNNKQHLIDTAATSGIPFLAYLWATEETYSLAPEATLLSGRSVHPIYKNAGIIQPVLVEITFTWINKDNGG